jgi:hypothetical protein
VNCTGIFWTWLHGATTPYERRYAFLEFAIYKSRDFGATDPRDRVFAPLSLASRYVPLEQQQNDWVVPDYRQDLTQIFIEVSTLLLRKLPIL